MAFLHHDRLVYSDVLFYVRFEIALAYLARKLLLYLSTVLRDLLQVLCHFWLFQFT